MVNMAKLLRPAAIHSIQSRRDGDANAIDARPMTRMVGLATCAAGRLQSSHEVPGVSVDGQMFCILMPSKPEINLRSIEVV